MRVSQAWRATHPGATVGVLIMRGVTNPTHHPGLEQRILEWDAGLRTRFGGGDRTRLRDHPILHAYAVYYRRFRKTYHVALQLESVLFKDQALPRSPALVAAMVAAELTNGLLTAGHDEATVAPPVTLEVAAGGERYVCLNGQEHALKAGDMMMVDGQGVISSVLYGPDQRTRITPSTRDVRFAVYAPPGIGALPVRRHLEDLRDAVRLVAPEALIEGLEVQTAG
ncbi:MAG TPA: phenylalanine--tRNA ligase beta subunit-related protein [Methylomirabilota bacterium]|nr:phenylalanine--tRNA ligase beta subunit-related protein [Methylomirabilota bacterium]